MQTSSQLASFDLAGFQGSQRIVGIKEIPAIMTALSGLLILLTLLLRLLVQKLLQQCSLLGRLT
jgi:hypothetical protein